MSAINSIDNASKSALQAAASPPRFNRFWQITGIVVTALSMGAAVAVMLTITSSVIVITVVAIAVGIIVAIVISCLFCKNTAPVGLLGQSLLSGQSLSNPQTAIKSKATLTPHQISMLKDDVIADMDRSQAAVIQSFEEHKEAFFVFFE